MPDDEYKLLKLATPLGKDVLTPIRFEGSEAVSKLFSFRLNMTSKDTSIDASKILGKQVTVSIKRPDETYRHFNGYVVRFSAEARDGSEEELRHYSSTIAPWFWLLKLNQNCRVFQEKTVPEIVEQICKDRGLTDYKLSLKGTYTKKDYCVQYNESDFDFISRLMQDVGIFYYFTHDDKKHQAVLGDAATAYVNNEETDLKFAQVYEDADADESTEPYGVIHRWKRQLRLISGKSHLVDYNFEAPAEALAAKEKTNVKLSAASDHELYEFPGGFLKSADGKPLAVSRIEAKEAEYEIASGASNCDSLSAGVKFKLQQHPVDSENNVSYAVTYVTHSAVEYGSTAEGGYSNEFKCVPAKVPVRPARSTARPLMTGPHSAKVVGGKNQEILTDKYGRVKIQFPWDREGKYDDKSSCFVRVAQSWAGSKRGFLFTPRVGDEVLVEFMNGDPDRPIVTGSVYNADNLPPWDPAAKSTVSGIKTFSTDKAKAKNFNELSFDDKIGKEKVYFHAERDFVRVVENNDELKIGFDAKDEGNQTVDIFNDRVVTIDKGKDTLHIKSGDRVMNIDKGDHVVTIKQGDHKVAIKAGQQSTEAAKAITFKVGPSMIKIDPQGVTIEAPKVSLLAQLKAEIKGTLVDVVGSGVTTVKGGLVKIN